MMTFKNMAMGCLVTFTSIIAYVNPSMAQKAEFGIRFMPTVSSFDMKTSAGGTVSGEATIGYGVGAFLGINFSEHVGIQGEAIYSSLYQKFKEDDEERKINLRYLSIPLLLSLNTGKSKMINLNLVAGPQLGISAGSSITSSNNNPANDEPILSVKKTDFGFAYGAGADFGINTAKNIRLGLGYRGVLGLVDISDNGNSQITDSYYVLDRTKVNTHSVYIGFSILF